MALPDLPDFNEFLSHLTISEPEIPSEYQSTDTIYQLQGSKDGSSSLRPYAVDQDNVKIPLPEYKLWYKVIGNLNLKSLIPKISNELEARNHLYNERIVLHFLCIFSLFPKRDEPPVITFNNILNSITSADLTQIYVLSLPPPDNFKFRFGSFSVGPIDMQKLEYRCKRAGSDYYERYANYLKGKLAFQRDVISVKLVNWSILMNENTTYLRNNLKIFNQLEDMFVAYFHLVSGQAFLGFWDTFMDEQHMTVSMGATYIDPLLLQKIIRCTYISIFLNLGKLKYGFVAPDMLGVLTMNLSESDRVIPEAEKKLKDEYNFTKFNDSEIHQTIKTFSRFIYKAKGHFHANRPDESFLHYVIALDLVLGDKDSSNKSIKERTAVLVYKALGNSYDDQKKIIGKIYDKRSRYVHKGEPVDPKNREYVEQICYQILLCLLRLQKVNDNHCSGFMSKWLKDIDYISKGIEADKYIPDNVIKDVGIDI